MRRLLLAGFVLALPLAALALSGACSGASGGSSVSPAPAPTPADDPRHVPPPDDGAGFASPPPTEEVPPAEPPTDVSPELAAQIRSTFGDDCRYERACGRLIGVDCKAAVDGPYYYVQRDSLAVVSTCGGACMRGCTNCPPREWTCATY